MSFHGGTKALFVGVISLVSAIFCIWFFWRVLHYEHLLRSDQDLFSQLSFESDFTADRAIEQLQQHISQKDLSDLVTADDPRLGSSQPLLQIVEFADFGCPHSQTASHTMRRLAAAYPEILSYTYRDFPIEELHPGATLAAQAGACAHAQGRFWEYHDKLFLHQEDLRKEQLVRLAKEVGLQLNRFSTCLDTQVYKEEVAADRAAGVAVGVTGTPTFFLNGQKVVGAIPERVLEPLLQRLLPRL